MFYDKSIAHPFNPNDKIQPPIELPLTSIWVFQIPNFGLNLDFGNFADFLALECWTMSSIWARWFKEPKKSISFRRFLVQNAVVVLVPNPGNSFTNSLFVCKRVKILNLCCMLELVFRTQMSVDVIIVAGARQS